MNEEKGLYVTSVIDIKKWDDAKWKGTVFLYDFKTPPLIGFAFQNRQAGIDIFKDWLERLGEKDRYEEIRISIIEGEIEGQDPGYTVHINSSLDNIIERAKNKGFEPESLLYLTIGRINRMNPAPNSRNLEIFKQEYFKHRRFKIFPAHLSQNGIEPILEYSIEKTEIFFRNSKDINNKDDIDYVVFGKDK